MRNLIDNTYFIHSLALPSDSESKLLSGHLNELPNTVLNACGDDKIFRLILLKHQPLHANIVLGMTPVSKGIDITHIEA